VNLGDPVPLNGVPDGCVARPVLVVNGSGEPSLPRDRSGRVKLTTVELSATGDGHASAPPTGREGRFLLSRETRRWPTIVSHYGDEDSAWSACLRLCRDGMITLSCDVVAARLGPVARWRWTPRTHELAEAQRTRRDDAGEAARRLLQTEHGVPVWVDGWLNDVAKSGLLARSAIDGGSLMVAAASCLAALPMPEGQPVTRTELAARHGGARGSHALDDGHRLTALVLRGAAAITGSTYPRSAAERRSLWGSVGVLCDSSSATVLVANLCPAPISLVSRQLCERAEARLPTHLTQRDLDAAPLKFRSGSIVHVCENPAVLEAALDRGVIAAIVCTAGNPTTVTMKLLHQLSECQATIFYRGDFDWPGIAIANRVIERLGCGTWLFNRQTYEEGMSLVAGDAVPLLGRPTIASWDERLSPAMEGEGVAIHEELLANRLTDYLTEVGYESSSHARSSKATSLTEAPNTSYSLDRASGSQG
jgi:uncharacterized protein (TIGR02679 family)